jgi:hypothetical protein
MIASNYGGTTAATDYFYPTIVIRISDYESPQPHREFVELTGRALREALKRERTRAAFERVCQLARRLRDEPRPQPLPRESAGRVCSAAERWRVMFF